MMEIFDLTQPLDDRIPVYPGDNRTYLKLDRWIERDGYTGFRLETGLHAATHLDAPLHLIAGGDGIIQTSIHQCIGCACMLDVRGREIIDVQPEYPAMVRSCNIVLFFTGWDQYYGKPEYYQKHPVLTTGMVDFLASENVGMIGLDCPSPDRTPFTVHKQLLMHQILIIENLTGLKQLVNLERFEIIALPLKIQAEASPARVIARPIHSEV